MKSTATGLLLMLSVLAPARPDTVSPLYARGYTVMPEPQSVKLGPSDFPFGADWKLEVQGTSPNDSAVEMLNEELEKRFRLKLNGRGPGVLRLTMAPNSATVGQAQDRDREALAEQAYKIDLTRDGVTIAANAPAGL